MKAYAGNGLICGPSYNVAIVLVLSFPSLFFSSPLSF